MQETQAWSLSREDSLEKNSLEFSPDKSHEPRSLEEYRPLGHKRVGHNLAIKQQ